MLYCFNMIMSDSEDKELDETQLREKAAEAVDEGEEAAEPV
jgi:hypothetical protein